MDVGNPTMATTSGLKESSKETGYIHLKKHAHTNIFAQRHWKKSIANQRFCIYFKDFGNQKWANDDWH